MRETEMDGGREGKEEGRMDGGMMIMTVLAYGLSDQCDSLQSLQSRYSLSNGLVDDRFVLFYVLFFSRAKSTGSNTTVNFCIYSRSLDKVY